MPEVLFGRISKAVVSSRRVVELIRLGMRFCPWYEKVMEEPSLSPSFNCMDASHSAHDECGIDRTGRNATPAHQEKRTSVACV